MHAWNELLPETDLSGRTVDRIMLRFGFASRQEDGHATYEAVIRDMNTGREYLLRIPIYPDGTGKVRLGNAALQGRGIGGDAPSTITDEARMKLMELSGELKSNAPSIPDPASVPQPGRLDATNQEQQQMLDNQLEDTDNGASERISAGMPGAFTTDPDREH